MSLTEYKMTLFVDVIFNFHVEFSSSGAFWMEGLFAFSFSALDAGTAS
jgi:hypothetical protein